MIEVGRDKHNSAYRMFIIAQHYVALLSKVITPLLAFLSLVRVGFTRKLASLAIAADTID